MQEYYTSERPDCCNQKMCKSGKVWSGRKKVQKYLCNKCGRTTLGKEVEYKETDHKPVVDNKERNEKIRAMRKEHPEYNLRKISEQFNNLSRASVCRILNGKQGELK